VGPYVVDQDALFTHLATEDLVINKTTYDISSSLSIKNIFGYSYMVDALDYAPSDTPYPIVLLNSPGTLLSGASLQMETTRTKTYSDEVQLPGKAFADRLNYLFGVFYLNSNQDYYVPTWIGANDAYVHFANTAGNKSYAGFTQASYAVTDQLNVTLGGRYTREDISMVQDAQSVFGQGNPQRATESHPSWTASLDYHLTHELMVYVTTRGSWRRGGFNGLDPPTPTPETAASKPGGNYFLPEQVRDVEGGFKFDGHIGALPVRADVAVYNSWVTDIQKTAYLVIAGEVATATVNVPKSDIKGVEADATIRPIDWLRLGASVTYTDARFTEPQSLLFGNPVVYGPFGDVARFSGSVYADTTWNLPGDKGALNYHIDLYGQSAFWFSNLGATIQPGTELPPYTLLNMRLDWDDMFGKGVKVSLFVKNVTDRLYYTGGAPNAQTYSLEQATFGMPRTYGIVIREKF
jgi:iron complex outermembrane recepter protein